MKTSPETIAASPPCTSAVPGQPRARRFAWKLTAFMLPFALLLAFPLVVFFLSGECDSTESVVRRQMRSPHELLFGPAFTNRQPYYKLIATQEVKPRVLILGTSRTMQLSPQAFLHPEQVYNAGGGIQYLWHAKRFLEALPPGGRPGLLILGLDQWEFNGRWAEAEFAVRPNPYAKDDPNTLHLLQHDSADIYRYYRSGRFEFGALLANFRDPAALGLSAISRGEGFRKDGTHSQPVVPQSLDERFRDTFERIAARKNRFESASEISPLRVNELRELLQFCRQKKIHVVAFLPPFPHAVFQALEKQRRDYPHIFELSANLKPLLAEFGGTLEDFADMAAFGAPDTESLDGFHGSDKAYLRLLLKLALADAQLGGLIDADKLKQLLQSER